MFKNYTDCSRNNRKYQKYHNSMFKIDISWTKEGKRYPRWEHVLTCVPGFIMSCRESVKIFGVEARFVRDVGIYS
jgi:hypothetical protein